MLNKELQDAKYGFSFTVINFLEKECTHASSVYHTNATSYTLSNIV